MPETCLALREDHRQACVLQAKTLAVESAKLQMRAAAASLKAVEEGINLHAQNRDYGKLKETAEASGLAAKVGNLRLHDISMILRCADGSCEIVAASHAPQTWQCY